MKKYKLRFFIEWGGNCLWPDSTDKDTYEKYDVGPLLPKDLGCSDDLCRELDALEEEYQTALDWEYPPDPSPWSEEHFFDFFQRLRCAYVKLCKELEYNFEITYSMNEEKW